MYQLLLEEEMFPNAGKHFSLNFLFVYNNVLAHRAWKFQKFVENQEINGLPWLVYSPYLNPIKHCWDTLDQVVNMRKVQPINLKELKLTFRKEWVNLNNKLEKSISRQINAVVKADRRSSWHGLFLRFTHVDHDDFSWIYSNFCMLVVLSCTYLWIFIKNQSFSQGHSFDVYD